MKMHLIANNEKIAEVDVPATDVAKNCRVDWSYVTTYDALKQGKVLVNARRGRLSTAKKYDKAEIDLTTSVYVEIWDAATLKYKIITA